MRGDAAPVELFQPLGFGAQGEYRLQDFSSAFWFFARRELVSNLRSDFSCRRPTASQTASQSLSLPAAIMNGASLAWKP